MGQDRTFVSLRCTSSDREVLTGLWWALPSCDWKTAQTSQWDAVGGPL